MSMTAKRSVITGLIAPLWHRPGHLRLLFSHRLLGYIRMESQTPTVIVLVQLFKFTNSSLILLPSHAASQVSFSSIAVAGDLMRKFLTQLEAFGSLREP
jgi:hypothetical protein